MSMSKLALISGMIAAVALFGGAVVLAKSSFNRAQSPAGAVAPFGQNGYGQAVQDGNGNGYYGTPRPGAGGSYGPGMMGGGFGYGPGMMGSYDYNGSGSTLWDQMRSAMSSGNWNEMYQLCRGYFNKSSY